MKTKSSAQTTTTDGKSRSFAAQLIITIFCVWLYMQFHPVMIGGQVQWIAAALAILASCMAFDLSLRLLLHLAKFLDWISTRKPSGKEGTASFATYKDIKKELKK